MERKISVCIEPALGIVRRVIVSVLVAVGKVKGRKYKGRTKLALVDQIPSLFVVGIDPDEKGSRKLFCDYGIKIVSSFWLNRKALLDGGLIGGADKFD